MDKNYATESKGFYFLSVKGNSKQNTYKKGYPGTDSL